MRAYLFFLFPFVFLSCINKHTKNIKEEQHKSTDILITTFDSAKWDTKIIVAIDSFVKEAKCSDCLNEIYIDKILPNYTLITIKTRTYSSEYMRDKHPLFRTKLSGVQFYVYSGIEDILKGDSKNMELPVDSSNNIFISWNRIGGFVRDIYFKTGAGTYQPVDCGYSLYC